LGGDTYVDAVVGRQYRAAADVVGALKDQGRLGQAVVLHLGNNGPMSAETFRRVMDLLVDVPKVVVVNVRVTKPWEPDVNRVLAEQVPTYPNARLIDWWESAMRRLVLRRRTRPMAATAYALLVTAASAAPLHPAATPRRRPRPRRRRSRRPLSSRRPRPHATPPASSPA
jgi:hypothetical protein